MADDVSVSTNSGGVGLVSLLTIVFVVLKLVGAIAWSWWWVLSPLWISGGIGIVLLMALFLFAAVVSRR